MIRNSECKYSFHIKYVYFMAQFDLKNGQYIYLNTVICLGKD